MITILSFILNSLNYLDTDFEGIVSDVIYETAASQPQNTAFISKSKMQIVDNTVNPIIHIRWRKISGKEGDEKFPNQIKYTLEKDLVVL